MSTTARRAAALTGLICAIVALAACNVVTAFVRTNNALASAGFTGISISARSTPDRGTEIDVFAKSAPAPSGLAPQMVAAQAVWENFPYRVDAVKLTIKGSASSTVVRSVMESAFGPRPAGYDSQSLSSAALSSGTTVMMGVLGSVALLALMALVLSRSTRRSRRRPPLPPDFYSWGGSRTATAPSPGAPETKLPGNPPSGDGQSADVVLPPGQWPPPAAPAGSPEG